MQANHLLRSLIKSCLLLPVILNSVSCTLMRFSEEDEYRGPVKEISVADRNKYNDQQLALNFLMPAPKRSVLPAPPRQMTSEVKAEMRVLLSGRQRTLRNNLLRGEKQAKLINQVLIDEGVPGEFIYLAMIESGFQSKLTSPMGAAGMWQFMKSTGRLYGLRVDSKVDERRDVILSTIAAARHLKDLYNKYRDWYLVMAGYNAGPGTVDRAIVKYGERDFWKLIRKGAFRQETRKFVAKFVAILIIMDNPEHFGFDMKCLTTYKGLNQRARQPLR